MIDYRCWVARARGFVEQLPRRVGRSGVVEVSVSTAPPMEEPELRAVQAALPLTIPGSLGRFWLEGSRHCACRYVWRGTEGGDLYGGPALIEPAGLPMHLFSMREWAEHTWIEDYPEEEVLWLQSLPILAMANGDYLALDLSPRLEDPPVLYLAHDDHSFALAPTFTGFLDAWERVGYVGPESWMLEGLLNGQRRLDPSTERAGEIRRLLRLA